MELIVDKDALQANIRTFVRGVASPNTEERGEYRSMVRRGTCFVIVQVEGEPFFAPSRFVGYRNNTLAQHTAAGRGDGRRTNKAITKIIGKRWVLDAELEAQYIKFCFSLGLEPQGNGAFGARRKFIDLRIEAL